MTEIPIEFYEKEGNTLTVWVNDPNLDITRAPGFVKITGFDGVDFDGRALRIKGNTADSGLRKVRIELPALAGLRQWSISNGKIGRVGGTSNGGLSSSSGVEDVADGFEAAKMEAEPFFEQYRAAIIIAVIGLIIGAYFIFKK